MTDEAREPEAEAEEATPADSQGERSDAADVDSRLAEFAATLASDRDGGEVEATLPTGASLGNYEVRGLIGRGTMGAVYEVVHQSLGKAFAAKVVATEEGQKQAAWRLIQEARTASSIDHENIVSVTDLGEDRGGRIYVVMELLQGEDLAARLDRHAREAEPAHLPDDEVRDLGTQFLKGLAAAHERSIVHRDLKPANLFLVHREERTVLKIVDFGMSKFTGRGSGVQLTRSGHLVGTPLYMAPEQGRAEKVDARTDHYAFGVIAYEMLTGSVPFPADSIYSCILMHALHPPPPLLERRPDLRPAVAEVVHRCLAKERDDRYATTRELLDAWRRSWATAPVSAEDARRRASTVSTTPPTPLTLEESVARAAESSGGLAGASAAEEPGAERESSHPAAARRSPALGAVALLVLGGVGGLVAGGVAWGTWSSTSDEARDGRGQGSSPAAEPEGPALGDAEDPATEPASPTETATETTPATQAAPVPPPGEATPPLVMLRSEPADALVRSGDAVLGRTPLRILVPEGGLEVEVSVPGYRTERQTLQPEGPDTVELRLRRRASTRRNEIELAPRVAP
ncbi:MAG: protein kinase [Sandaracinaceae bacterium]